MAKYVCSICGYVAEGEAPENVLYAELVKINSQ